MKIRWPWGKKKQRTGSNRAAGTISRESFKRGYMAAQSTRLLVDWPVFTASANEEIKAALDVMRHRCRELARNDSYARRFLRMVKSNVIGKDGILLVPQAVNPNGAMDEAANLAISGAWAEWGKRGNCTVDGRLSWIDAQNLFIESVARDGESLIMEYHGWKGNRFGYALGFVELSQLETLHDEALQNGNSVRMSVELDKYGRPVAYHLLTYDPDDNHMYLGGVQAKRHRVTADAIIHGFISEFPQQIRGVPWMHTAGRRLKMLDGYEEAELIAARTAAAKMGFLLSENGEEWTGDDDDTAEGRAAAPVMDASPGTIEQLPKGMTFTGWDPTHPTTAFPEFEKALLRGVASGVGVAYVGLANNLEGVNLSSIRQGSLDEQEYWRELQNWTVQTLNERVYGNWLLHSITDGAVRLPVAKIEKFKRVKWQPKRWKRVDPLKEASGNELSVKMGSKSLQDVAGERGRDLERVFEENQAAVAMAKKYGMESLVQAIFGGPESNDTAAARGAQHDKED